MFHAEISSMFPGQIPYRPSPPLANLPERCPVRSDFGDLASPQDGELIPHIDVLRRILLSAPGENRTAWMMPFPSFGCPPDGFLLFLISKPPCPCRKAAIYEHNVAKSNLYLSVSFFISSVVTP